MTFLNGLHGTFAALLIAALLFVDELGVPMPFAPNEALLLVAGLLIAGGALPPFIFLPLAVIAMGGGMVCGFAWARALGAERLRGFAERLGGARTYDRATARIRRSGPVGIALTRLIPGVRVYATLVAGAAEVDLRVFLAGAVPAIVIWAGFFTALGIVVGVPAEHLLSRFERLGATGGLMLLLGTGTYLALRRLPAAGPERLAVVGEVPGRVRIGLAMLVDAGIVVMLVAGVDRLVRSTVHQYDPGRPNQVITLAAAVVLAYILVARRGTGSTAGEGVFDVSYRDPRHIHARPRPGIPEPPPG